MAVALIAMAGLGATSVFAVNAIAAAIKLNARCLTTAANAPHVRINYRVQNPFGFVFNPAF
jgi:hypothetical protein